MATPRAFFRDLASVVAGSPWSPESVRERVTRTLGRRGRTRWAQDLAGRIVRAFGTSPPPPRAQAVLRFLQRDQTLRELMERWRSLPEVDTSHQPPPTMAPSPRIPASWDLPALTTPGALAGWLGLDPGELDWFADCQGRQRRTRTEALRHYRYRWLAKRGGSARLLEIPKARLKSIQRRVLDGILSRVTPHRAAHAFCRGRSVASYVAPHAGRDFVLRIDLRDFFPSIPAGRVSAVFRTIGYPENVARRTVHESSAP